MEHIESLVPPLRFSSIQPNLYRGGYPRKVNFPFLESLNLKTIVSLTPEAIDLDTDADLYSFAKERKIILVHIECAQSGKGKKRGVPLGYSSILEVLQIIILTEHAPVYFHCLNGGQVTSLVTACLRKIQLWSSIAIFNEFINFTTNITVNDRNFVEGFRGQMEIRAEHKPKWLWSGMSKGVASTHSFIRILETE